MTHVIDDWFAELHEPVVFTPEEQRFIRERVERAIRRYDLLRLPLWKRVLRAADLWWALLVMATMGYIGFTSDGFWSDLSLVAAGGTAIIVLDELSDCRYRPETCRTWGQVPGAVVGGVVCILIWVGVITVARWIV